METLQNNQEDAEELDPFLVNEVRIKIPRESDYKFMIWMKQNNYALKSIKEYHQYIRKLLQKKETISVEQIKSYLSIRNNLPKRSAVKLFIIFLEDMHNVVIPPFRYTRIKKSTNSLEVLSEDSFNKVYDAMREDLKLFMELMYYGGLRVSEVVRIKSNWFNWSDWYFNQEDYGELKIIKAKRNKERVIPISPKLMVKIFRSIPKHKETGALQICHLFDFRYKRYMRRKKRKGIPEEASERRYVEKSCHFFHDALKEASLKALGRGIKTHTLRSTRASDLEILGLPPSSIRDFLGHDNISTTSRYLINTPGKLKAQIKKLEEEN